MIALNRTLHGPDMSMIIQQHRTGMSWAEAVAIGPTLVMQAIVDGRIGYRPDNKHFTNRELSEESKAKKLAYNRKYNRDLREKYRKMGLTSCGKPPRRKQHDTVKNPESPSTRGKAGPGHKAPAVPPASI